MIVLFSFLADNDNNYYSPSTGMWFRETGACIYGLDSSEAH